MCLYFHANMAVYKILGIKYYGFFQSVVLKKALEGPLDYKEIKPVNLKVNQHWILIGKTNAEVEAPVLGPLDAKSPFIGKDSDARGDWRPEKGKTEDEMVGWYHWFNGHELGQTLGDGEGQGSLVCCSPWGCRVRHNLATEQESTPLTGEDACEQGNRWDGIERLGPGLPQQSACPRSCQPDTSASTFNA